MPVTRLVFLGPPGSGKGTQAQRLSASLGLVQLSSGDVLRREMRENSDIGRRAAEFYNAGKLVPDEIVSGIMVAAVQKLPAGTGFVLDGFPRTVPQAQVLDRDLAALKMNLDAVLDFRLDDALIIRRIVGRRICGNCNATYNTEFFPPRKAETCDRCGGALQQRADDREDVVVTRLETYRKLTAPLVEYYSRRGLLHAIDAGQSADAVEAAAAEVIASLSAGA
jgi:adenylate kinase